MTEKPLSQRMIEAADILEAFNTEYSDLYNLDGGWRPSELRREAEHRETEEREVAEARRAEALPLALDLMEVGAKTSVRPAPPIPWVELNAESQEFWLSCARLLFESGWRRGSDD